ELERERDEARRANSEWLDELDSEQMALRIAEGERDQAIRERDEWKQAWEGAMEGAKIEGERLNGEKRNLEITIDALRAEIERLKSGRYERGDVWNEMVKQRDRAEAAEARVRELERLLKAMTE